MSNFVSYENAASLMTAIDEKLDEKVVKVEGKALSTNDYDNTAKGIVDGVTAALADKVDKVTGKGLSTEDYTTAEKTKLSGVAEGAQVNVIESITVNGTAVSPDANKTVALTVMTNAVNDLVNYYKKSETYTQSEVDALIAAIVTLNIVAVSELPTTDISRTTIYLVPKTEAGTQNAKDEYINLDGTTTGWEKIGDTEIDLSDYVTTSDLNTALADYTTTTDLTTLLGGYIAKSQTAGLVKNDGSIDTNTYLTQHQDISGKADKVASATNGDLAGLDSNGNLTDSGVAAANVIVKSQTAGLVKNDGTIDTTQYVSDISGKADKVTNATNGNLAGLNSSGNVTDSGVAASDVIVKSQTAGLVKNDGTIDTNTYLTSVDGLTTAEVNALIALLN